MITIDVMMNGTFLLVLEFCQIFSFLEQELGTKYKTSKYIVH